MSNTDFNVVKQRLSNIAVARDWDQFLSPYEQMKGRGAHHINIEELYQVILHASTKDALRCPIAVA